MASQINASNSGFGGVVTSGDSSGILQLQTASTTAVTVDASQNVGIGTTSPSALGAGRTSVNINGTTDGLLWLGSNGTYTGYVQGTSTAFNVVGNSATLALVATGANVITASTNSSERMRIDSSGNVLVGTTTVGRQNANATTISPANAIIWTMHSGTASGSVYIDFSYNGGQIGSISQNGTTAVAYNTSSDYRLKENIVPMTGALDKVAQLKPVTYTWKADNSAGQGFIAHELQAVVPDCVTGEKDAVDAEGKPIYQGVDTSFLVATLTAAIQEQTIIINDLKARIETLEGAKIG